MHLLAAPVPSCQVGFEIIVVVVVDVLVKIRLSITSAALAIATIESDQ